MVTQAERETARAIFGRTTNDTREAEARVRIAAYAPALADITESEMVDATAPASVLALEGLAQCMEAIAMLNEATGAMAETLYEGDTGRDEQ